MYPLRFFRSCRSWFNAWLPFLRRVDDSPTAGPLYHYVVLRRDVPLGVQIAQTIHAAGESSPGNLPETTHAIALHAKDEAQLLALEVALADAGIPFRAIREPDAPWCGALMAIGLSPAVRTPTMKRLLGRLPLAK